MKAVVAALTAVCMATLAALLMSAFAGGMSPLLAWTALAWGATAGSFAWGAMKEPFPPAPPVRSPAAWGVIASVTPSTNPA